MTSRPNSSQEKKKPEIALLMTLMKHTAGLTLEQLKQHNQTLAQPMEEKQLDTFITRLKEDGTIISPDGKRLTFSEQGFKAAVAKKVIRHLLEPPNS